MAITLLSNAEVYQAAQDFSESFLKSSAKYSVDEFYKYVGALDTEDARKLANEFLTTSMQFYLERVYSVKAKNPLEEAGIGYKIFQEASGLLQRMYVRTKPGMSPKFKNIQDGKGADPFQVTKPIVSELFYYFNESYQNNVTFSDVEMKTAFASLNGVSVLINGAMESFASQYIEWELNNQLETINHAINDEDHPLRDSQIVEVEIADEDDITEDELRSIVLSINNVKDAMTYRTTSAFNTGNWPTLQKVSDLRLLWRSNIRNTISNKLLSSAFHKEDLNTGIKETGVLDFGGLIPTSDGTLANRLYPVYDDDERPTGEYTTDEEGTTPYTGTDVIMYDPNADVIGIIADKDFIFEVDQNPYSVYGMYNPANMCTTYWANKPNVGFHNDRQKNLVVIKKKNNSVTRSISLSPSSVTIASDESTATLTATIVKEDLDTVEVSVSNTAVATAEISGSTVTVTKVAAGTTKGRVKIVDSSNVVRKYKDFNITVEETPAPTVESITFDPVNLSIDWGETTGSVSATIVKEADHTIEVTSDDSSVATAAYNNGTLTVTKTYQGNDTVYAAITVAIKDDETTTVSKTLEVRFVGKPVDVLTPNIEISSGNNGTLSVKYNVITADPMTYSVISSDENVCTVGGQTYDQSTKTYSYVINYVGAGTSTLTINVRNTTTSEILGTGTASVTAS